MKKYRQLAKEIVPTKSLLTVFTPSLSGNKHLIESITSDPLHAIRTGRPAKPETIFETISETISEAVLIEVSAPSVSQPPVAFAPISLPQETPVPVVPVSVDNMSKYLTDRSFQQPNPDPVPQEMDAVTAKLKFLEQAIGRIAAHGPGSGEVNLRYLDDIDRPSIVDGKFLKYNGTTKKFEFADPLAGDIDIAQVNSDWNAVSGVAQILNKPTIPTSFDRLISPDTTKEFVLTNNGTVTMPFGSLFTETSTTLILTPPGAFPGQGLVISPTTGTGLSADVAFSAGATITVRLTDAGSHTHEDLTGSGGRDGSWPYTITGATAYQLGLAGLSGTFLAIDWVLLGGNYVNDIVINVPIGTTATGFVVTLDDQVGPPYTGFPVPTTITLTVGSIVTPSESSHIHILSGDQTNVDLYLGNDNQYVKVGKNNGDVTIGTNGNTNNWIFSADGSTTVPDGLYLPTGNMTETIASVEVIIDDLVLDMVVDYSTGEGDNIPADTYGTHIQINHPWTVYQFTTDPAPPLEVEDIIAGEGVPEFSQVLVIGTGIYTKIVVTDKTVPLVPPEHNQVITITRPITLATLSLNTVADTNISLLPTGLGNVLFESDLIPITSGQHSLGTPTRRFKQLWLSGESIYIQDETTGADLRVTAIDGDLVIAGGAGLSVGEFRFHDNQIYITNPDREIIIGQPDATGAIVINRPIQVVSGLTGNPSFEVDRSGMTTIGIPNLAIGQTALSITADANGETYDVPQIAGGSLVHITNKHNIPPLLTFDSFGDFAPLPVSIIGRRFRGTITAPAVLQAGDNILTISAAGYANAATPTGLPTVSSARMLFVADETFNATSQAGHIEIFSQKIGGTGVEYKGLMISHNGLVIPSITQGGTGLGGITFADGTIQTTAGITSASVGDGLTGSVVDGVLTIDATGVQSVTAAVGAGEIAITSDLGGRNLTLTLPQPLGTTSTPEFLSLTLHDLTVNGTFTTAINTTISGKILYLASDATLASQIDGGGVVLGTGLFAKSILYDLTPDRWDTDGAGLKTENLEAIDGLFTGVLESRGHAMFGTGYIGTDYPNTTIQSDTNVNDFGYVVNTNHNGGTNASSDFRAVNDIGSASANFIDMGINSSTFANPAQSITGTNDGYLYVNGGDLVIGTESAGANILMHTGGNTIDKLRGTWSDTGLNVVGSVTASRFYGPLTGNVTGNADTVTNGVYTNGSYANPSWITSLAYSKLTGTPTIPAAQIQSDWNQTNNALLDYIKNKPTLTNGTVTSVSGTGTVSGLTLTGTVTSTGNLTLGGTIDKTSSSVFGIAKVDGTTITATGGVISAAQGQLVYVNNAVITMSTGTGVQNLFGLTNGVTLASNTRYIYRMIFTLAKTGSNDPSLLYGLGLSGGAVLAKHAYSVQANSNNTRTGDHAGITMMTNDITTAFSTGVKICSMSGGTTWQAFVFEGIIDVTTGGNVSFQVQGSKTSTALSMRPLGMVTLMPVSVIGANTAVGTWA
jgi:hypothetical protein